MDPGVYQQAFTHMAPNMIAILFVDERSSSKYERVAYVTDTLGRTKTWEVRVPTNCTTDTVDMMLRFMADTNNPLGDIRDKIEDIREVASRYSDTYGAWATESEDEKLRVARLKAFRADEYIHEVARLPLLSNVPADDNAREHKKALVRWAKDCVKQARKNLVQLGEYLNERHGRIGDGALLKDKKTLTEASFFLTLWAVAFEQELFH